MPFQKVSLLRGEFDGGETGPGFGVGGGEAGVVDGVIGGEAEGFEVGGDSFAGGELVAGELGDEGGDLGVGGRGLSAARRVGEEMLIAAKRVQSAIVGSMGVSYSGEL